MPSHRGRDRALADQAVDADDIREAVASFDRIWDQLTIQESGRVFELLIEQIIYDADESQLAITFCPGGIKLLRQQEKTA